MKNTRKLMLTLLIVALGSLTTLGHGGDFSVFVETTESAASFDTVTAALDAGIATSDFELLGSWDAVSPKEGATYRSHVYVLDDPAYTAEVGKFEGPHAPAALLRVNVYEFGRQKTVRVNFVDPETMARVYLFEHGVDEASFHALIDQAAGVSTALETLITNSVEGNTLTLNSGPIRAESDLLPYVGDGDAQVMVNFADYAADYDQGLVKTFNSFEAATQYAQDHIANNSENWELVATLDVGQARLYGLTKGAVESISATIVGDALGASADNPVPGINHNAAYPIGVLVYPDGGQFKLAYPAQMWRMMLYYWDAGIGAFVQYQTLPGDFDASLLAMLGG